MTCSKLTESRHLGVEIHLTLNSRPTSGRCSRHTFHITNNYLGLNFCSALSSVEYDAPVFSGGIHPQILVTDLQYRVNAQQITALGHPLRNSKNMTRPANAILSLFVVIDSRVCGFPAAMAGFRLHPPVEGKNYPLECSSEPKNWSPMVERVRCDQHAALVAEIKLLRCSSGDRL
jgi:hypothetical protein